MPALSFEVRSSSAPWQAFLGKQLHAPLSLRYRVNNPGSLLAGLAAQYWPSQQAHMGSGHLMFLLVRGWAEVGCCVVWGPLVPSTFVLPDIFHFFEELMMEKFELSMMSEIKCLYSDWKLLLRLPEIAPNVISLRNFTSDFLLAQELSIWGCFSLISE